MAKSGWWMAALGGLLIWHPAVTRADYPPAGNGFGPPAASQNWQPAYSQYTAPVQPDRPRAQNQQNAVPDTDWNEPLVLPPSTPQPQFQPGVPSAPSAMTGMAVVGAPGQYVLPPPPGAAEIVPPAQPVNGTWRDDGQFVVIEVNGQQLRLAKSALGPPPAGAPLPGPVHVGAVHGRLMQKGRPLVNCQVVIVPMNKNGAAAAEDGIRQPMVAITDADGFYGFANVPVGGYKLTWLPDGTSQWIRRIELKPDVFVHEGQDVTAKDIKSAMQTIN